MKLVSTLLLLLATSTLGQLSPSQINFSFIPLSVNGSSATGHCANNITKQFDSFQCNDPTSSVVYDGHIPTLTGLDGNMWASQLLTINASSAIIGFTFDTTPNFVVRRAEIVVFNCPKYGISVQSVAIRDIDNISLETVNLTSSSCDSLVRVCIPGINITSSPIVLRLTTVESTDWIHIAEIGFYEDRSYCSEVTTTAQEATDEAPVTTPEAPVTAPEVPITAPEASVTAPEAPVTALEALVTTPEAPVTTPEVPVTAPEASVTAPEAPVTALEALVTTPEAPVTTHEAPVTTPEASVAAPEAPVTALEALVTTPEAPVTTHEAPVTTPEAPVAAPEALVTAPEALVTTPETTEEMITTFHTVTLPETTRTPKVVMELESTGDTPATTPASPDTTYSLICPTPTQETGGNIAAATTTATESDTKCPSCSTSTTLASVITAITTALLATLIFVLLQIALCKYHPKFTPGKKEPSALAGGEEGDDDYELMDVTKEGVIGTQLKVGPEGNSIDLEENAAYGTLK